MEKSSLSLSQSPSTNLEKRYNGPIKLPPGFRFHPTDEELVLHYLRRKVLSCPLPASIVLPTLDLSKYNPWDLAGGCGHERYFFALRRAKHQHGTRSNRSTNSGYWKATGKDRTVVASKCNGVVGMKKVLVFYRGKGPKGLKTDWILHEYRLANTAHSVEVPVGDWVLCRIFMKKRAKRMDFDSEEHRATRFIDSLSQREAADSDTSCVTEASDESIRGEDVSSSSTP